MQAQLVDEALFERLADDVAAAHDHDVTIPSSRSNRTSRGREWVTTKNGGVSV